MEELEKTYAPAAIEEKWYSKWLDGKYFRPKRTKKNQSYCIIMPPPNVTGALHMGHALDIANQDGLIRYKRMKGYETLFLPGLDHAGISTQSVVEKMIFEQTGQTRHDIPREEFLAKIWEWKEQYGGRIIEQQKKMGASADWDSLMFTMDPDANYAVRKFFTDMYNEGLIYQSDYIVNWDTVLQSAISDAEVNHVEVKGNFYHIKYEIKDSDEFLEIATTRPETMLADTAICVHPDDIRYIGFIGKTAIIPICNREIPIIADSYVDREKGTGCLKVTPGHDFNDFEIGKRHALPIINMLDKDGRLNEVGGDFKGLKVNQARDEIIKKLEDLGMMIKIVPHVHQVGHGERSKTVIEPLVSKQWFLKTSEIAKMAVSKVENGDTKFFPKGWENTYFSWLREPKDWCISRQLVWGHRIPIYYCEESNHTWASIEEPTECPISGSKNFTQDPDVLDTWFSSGLWPLTTLGWPNEQKMRERGFDRFYPTNVLVTGYDIIFFWVARMMMMGLKAVHKIPFEDIYIHAIVRDKCGQKMSKSLGNGIDPLETIKEYGTDALRFTLLAGSGYNRNLNLDPARISGYRNFMNKIWNAFRFIYPNLEKGRHALPEFSQLDHHERWILSELSEAVRVVSESLEEYRFDDACSKIYSFVYDKFCSWFIELSKPILYSPNEAKKDRRVSVLKYCFRNLMILMHPFTPFITEEIWGYLKDSEEDLLIIQEFPEFDSSLVFNDDQDLMNKFIDTVTLIRNLRASVDVKPKDIVDVFIFTDDTKLIEYFKENDLSFSELSKSKILKIELKNHLGDQRPLKSVMGATGHVEVYISLEGVVNIHEQIRRIEKEITKTEMEYNKLKAKLHNEKFISKAPDEVVLEVKLKASEFKEKLDALQENLKRFGS